MSSQPPVTGFTAQAFLLGTIEQDTMATLSRRFAEPELVRKMGSAVSRLDNQGAAAVNEELTSTTAALLNHIDIGDLLIAAFRTHRRLVDAARATLRAPGSGERVQLASQQVSSIHEPTVDLLVNDVHLHTFRLKLTLTFEIDLVVAMIRHGALVALSCGQSMASGQLLVDGFPLIEQKYPVDLQFTVHLRQPIPLASGP